MNQFQSRFLAKSEVKAHDLEHKRKISWNIQKYNTAVLKGKEQFAELDMARKKAKNIKWKAIEELDKRAISEKTIKVGYDPDSGFIGTKVSSSTFFECSNLEKLLILFSDGTYRVISIPEKQYIQTKESEVVWIGIADKKTPFSVIYTDKLGYPYAKRFVIKQFILDKEYPFLDRDQKLHYITAQEGVVELHFKPKPKQKVSSLEFSLSTVAVKGVTAKGMRIANKELKQIKLIKSGEE